MPSTPDIDERYSELTTLVRATRPRAPESLRQRVRVTAATPEPMRRQWFTSRRLALVLVAGALVALGGVLASRDGGGRVSTEADGGRAIAEADRLQGIQPSAGDDTDATKSTVAPARESAVGGQAVPPSGTRLQDYRADLTVRVEDTEALSSATASAMRTARSLGGYVVTARYDTPGDDEGDSYLVVRVPVNRVQDAILRFTQLGTIVSQSIQVEDLQNQVNRQTESIASLRRTITRLEELLKDPSLPIEQRAELEVRLLNAKDQLNRAVNAKEQTVRRASLARVALTLTTREDVKPVEPKNPGYFEQTIRDAAASLEKVGAWTVAGAIVGGPFLLLLGAAWLAARNRRRRSDQRLLERPQP